MKKKLPKVSVVMLNYNGLKYLKRTILPILKLDYPNYEFIIVDNGSTDGSIEFIKKIKKIRLIQSPRLREKNFACNYAIEKAEGEYILLIDNDLLLSDIKLLYDLIDRCNTNKDTGCYSIAFIDEFKNNSPYYGGFYSYHFIVLNKNIFIKELLKIDKSLIGYPNGGAVFIKKSIWQEVGGYDEHLIFGGDDNDLGIKLWLMGYKNYLYSKTIQIHLGLPEQKDNKKFTLKWKEMTYAHIYSIFKNYRFINLIITLFGFTGFTLIRSIKQSLFRFHPGQLVSFFKGYYLFIKNLPIALKKRKEIQSKRIIKEDIFLKVKPPKFD